MSPVPAFNGSRRATKTAYTPPVGNITLGTGGTRTGLWSISDGWCDAQATITLGTGFSITGSPIQIGLPVPKDASWAVWMNVKAILIDTGSTFYEAVGRVNATNFELFAKLGADGSVTSISATVPFTWAAGDQMIVTARFPIPT